MTMNDMLKPSIDPITRVGFSNANPTPEIEEAPKVEPVVETPKPEETIKSSQLAALVKQEKQNRLAQQRLKQEQESVNKIKAELEAEKARQATLRNEVLIDPRKALEHFGLSVDDLVLWGKNNGQVTPETANKLTEQKVNAFIEEQKRKEEELAKRQAEAQAIAERQAEQQFKLNIAATVERLADDFPIIYEGREKGMVNDVYAVIDENFRNTGVIMPIEDALKLTEDYYSFYTKSERIRKKYFAETSKPTDTSTETTTKSDKAATDNAQPNRGAVFSKSAERENTVAWDYNKGDTEQSTKQAIARWKQAQRQSRPSA